MELRIKPVSKGYFATSSVGLRDIAVKRQAGVAIFAERHNPDGSVTQVWLIPEPAKMLRVGNTYEVRNAENNRKYGPHTIVGAVQFRVRRGVITLKDTETATTAYSTWFDLSAVAFELV